MNRQNTIAAKIHDQVGQKLKQVLREDADGNPFKIDLGENNGFKIPSLVSSLGLARARREFPSDSYWTSSAVSPRRYWTSCPCRAPDCLYG